MANKIDYVDLIALKTYDGQRYDYTNDNNANVTNVHNALDVLFSKQYYKELTLSTSINKSTSYEKGYTESDLVIITISLNKEADNLSILGGDSNPTLIPSLLTQTAQYPFPSTNTTYRCSASSKNIEGVSYTKSDTESIMFYNKYFYGSVLDAFTLDSTNIRSLSNVFSTTSTFNIETGNVNKRVIIAVPKGKIVTGKDEDALNAPITFNKINTIKIKDASGISEDDYDIYENKTDVAYDVSHTFKITIK